ncbi:MAG: hypothetical protein QF441_12760 [Bacteriovoracaceae bacterium]|jgi:hypothetical protein|nr:hypothetical protein [Bacteriovoracaceae bacterium]
MRPKHLSICLITLSCLNFGASAAQETTTKKNLKAEISTKIKKPYEQVVTYESMKNRDGKKTTLNVGLLGNTFEANSTSLELGYFLDLNTVLSLQFHDLASYNNETTGDEVDKAWNKDGEGYALSAGLKKYVSNSFYYKPEIYYRKQTRINSISYNYSFGSSTRDLIGTESTDFSDIGISFKIGNQWQWDNFTLGTDWVGLASTVAMLEQSGDVESHDKTNLTLLNFYLGYTF